MRQKEQDKQAFSSLEEAVRQLGCQPIRALPALDTAQATDEIVNTVQHASKARTDSWDADTASSTALDRDSEQDDFHAPGQEASCRQFPLFPPLLGAWKSADQQRLYLVHPWPFQTLKELLDFSPGNLGDDSAIRLIIYQVPLMPLRKLQICSLTLQSKVCAIFARCLPSVLSLCVTFD